jgi:signal transduction histidine kinase
MRLALKIFVANALVILVLVGVAVWTLGEVAKLIGSNRDIAVRATDALRVEASLREQVETAHRFEMRFLVFGDREYEKVPSQAAVRIQSGLDRLGDLLATEVERVRARRTIEAFAAYRAAIAQVRQLRADGDPAGANRLLETRARPALERVMAEMDGLVAATQTALHATQTEARAALGQTMSEVNMLRARTWNAVIVAMGAAVLAALAGAGVIALGMTRAIRRLAAAAAAIPEGGPRAAVPVEGNDEIGALARSFNAMAQRLREIDLMKEQFYATMSHELKSPLTSAREAAHLLEQGDPGPLTEKQQKLVSIIYRSTDRLLRLVSQVLDLSRLSAGVLPFERRAFPLDRAVRRAVKETRLQADERKVKIETELGAGNFEVFADEDRIVQIVVNLVVNGVRFTRPAGSVIVRLVDAGPEVEIQVEDTGVGIPPAALPHVFERYRQAHTGYGGTGLGLAIVRGLVDAHGGRVTVESQEGKGTRFSVVLPRGSAPAAPAAPERAS